MFFDANRKSANYGTAPARNVKTTTIRSRSPCCPITESTNAKHFRIQKVLRIVNLAAQITDDIVRRDGAICAAAPVVDGAICGVQSHWAMETQRCSRDRGLHGEGVQAGAGQPPALQRGNERGFVDQPARRAVLMSNAPGLHHL